VVVIGAGVGGLAAARAAAGAGADVTVVGNERPGGRGVWHSLLPSKVLLTLADGLGQSARLPGLGLRDVAGAPDAAATMRRIAELSRSWSGVQAAGLDRLGVRFVDGRAAFIDPHRVEVDGGGPSATLDADAVVIATGSVPVFPPALKPDGRRVIAPRFVSKLERLPASVVVVGAGATGAEFVYGFNRLGAAVTWVVDEFGVLPAFDREAAGVLVEALERRGVVRHEGLAARSAAPDGDGVKVVLDDGRELSAEMAFIGLGRRPDVTDLGVERAGLSLEAARGFEVDGYCRSAVPHVYAVGDATGKPFIANKAMAQGRIAGLHAAGAPAPAYDAHALVEAVYTDPEVAQIGSRADGARVLRLPYRMNLKAALAGETAGFVKLFAETAGGVVLGASAVGAHAADALAPLALGLRLRATVDDLAASFAAHPGVAESVYAAARDA
jgi:dihydrolipoamide dehydrogenase